MANPVPFPLQKSTDINMNIHDFWMCLQLFTQVRITTLISKQGYPWKDILKWIFVTMNIHERISMFYGYQFSIIYAFIDFHLDIYSFMYIHLDIHVFMDIHLDILGSLWISMH